MNEVMTKPETPTGVTLLAKINLIFYVLLLFWAVSLVFSMVGFVAGFIVLYSVAGITCSWGLLQHTRWGGYMAIVSWTIEGIVSSWAAYMSIGLSPVYPQSVIMFVLIALFKFASTAYLVRGKVEVTANEK